MNKYISKSFYLSSKLVLGIDIQALTMTSASAGECTARQVASGCYNVPAYWGDNPPLVCHCPNSTLNEVLDIELQQISERTSRECKTSCHRIHDGSSRCCTVCDDGYRSCTER